MPEPRRSRVNADTISMAYRTSDLEWLARGTCQTSYSCVRWYLEAVHLHARFPKRSSNTALSGPGSAAAEHAHEPVADARPFDQERRRYLPGNPTLPGELAFVLRHRFDRQRAQIRGLPRRISARIEPRDNAGMHSLVQTLAYGTVVDAAAEQSPRQVHRLVK